MLEVKPFKIAISDEAVADLKTRLGHARWSHAITNDWSRGQPASLIMAVSYTHLDVYKRQDSYWLSVNYGMVEEVRRLGVAFDVFEAGGYPNLSRQIDQLKGCASDEFDAVILGAVSYSGLTAEVERIARLKPVIAAVNDIDDSGITAKASVPWPEMGAAAGRFLAERHPKGSPPVTVAWFPGPLVAGWVTFCPFYPSRCV